jgi:hypothetical protein
VQPEVALFWSECERLSVVALGGSQVALVEGKVTEAVERGGDGATMLAPDLDRACLQLSPPLELADDSEPLRDAVQRPGDPIWVTETFVDR